MRSFLYPAAMGIVLAAQGVGCTFLSSSLYPGNIDVGPDFRVKVVNRGVAVEGLSLQIFDAAVGLKLAKTDKDGLASFRSVRPGTYHLEARAGVGIEDVYLKVAKNRSKEVTVEVGWSLPWATLFRANAMKGTLRSADQWPGEPRPRMSVDLVDAISGRKLKNITLSERGEFDFGPIPPGLYVLGGIPVTIDRNATADRLDVEVVTTSCGPSYRNAAACRGSEISMQKLAGGVVDGTGGPVPGVMLKLIDFDEKVVDEAHSDALGTFSFPQPRTGTFQLWARVAGFTPFNTVVQLNETGDASPLVVQLGLFGACSAVSTHR